MLNMYCTYICIVFILCTGINAGKSALENYGPYVLNWTDVELCRDFKLPSIVTSTVDLITNPNQAAFVRVNYTLKNPIKVDMMKIKVYNFQGQQKKVLWNYSLNNPCQHFVVAAVITEHIHNNECRFRQGNNNIDADLDITRKLLGNSFFYGMYNLRVSLHASKRNILCISVSLMVKNK